MISADEIEISLFFYSDERHAVHYMHAFDHKQVNIHESLYKFIQFLKKKHAVFVITP